MIYIYDIWLGYNILMIIYGRDLLFYFFLRNNSTQWMNNERVTWMLMGFIKQQTELSNRNG